MFLSNFMPLHLIVFKIFRSKLGQGINKVIRIHLLETMNVCIQ